MASEFYVAEDGSIHRHPVTVINNHGNRTNTYAPAPAAAYAQTRTEYRPIHQVSEGRIVWFWIISIIMALLIAVGVTQGFGAEFYGSDGDNMDIILIDVKGLGSSYRQLQPLNGYDEVSVLSTDALVAEGLTTRQYKGGNKIGNDTYKKNYFCNI